MKPKCIFIIAVIFSAVFNYNFVSGHCDTMDGPVVADARKAIENNNVNYVLKWVFPEYENEITDVFDLIMKVRVLSPEAMEVADRYFFETVVRIHRSGEGMPFTGVKPSGTPIDEKIQAADKSIELGNLSPLKKLVPDDKFPELEKRFDKVMQLRDFDVDNVAAGREYIEAYVKFFHFAEGEEEDHGHEPVQSTEHTGYLPWILSGILLISTLVLAGLKTKKR